MFFPRNLTGCSRYKTSITTTSAVTLRHGGEEEGGREAGGTPTDQLKNDAHSGGGPAHVNAFHCHLNHQNNSKYQFHCLTTDICVMCLSKRTCYLSVEKNKKNSTFTALN